MSQNTFTLAVIGCGRWGQNHAKTAEKIFGDSLKYICDKDEASKNRLPKELSSKFVSDVALVLNDKDVNAVIIATPAETHFALAKECILKGKHVLVEKPLSLFSTEAEELEKLAKSKKVTLMVGHLLLFHPAIVKIKDLVQSGTLGRLQYIYSNRLNLGSVRKEENILWSFAPHDISVLSYLTESEPLSVSATGGVFLQPGIHDVTVTTLTYPNNVHAHIHVSWLHPFKEHRLVVIGDKSMIVFEDTKANEKLLHYPKGIDWIHGEPIKREENYRVVEFSEEAPLEIELKHFAECVREGKIPLTDSHSAISVLKTLEKAQKSLDGDKKTKQETQFILGDKAYVHPSALVDSGCSIGNNSKIWHFSHIQANTKIGEHCSIGQNVNVGNNVRIGNFVKIQNNVSVYEGVELEDYVFCGPSMVFTNILNPRCEFPQRGSEFYTKTLIKFGASIGANATIVCGTTLGRFSFVGAGAVVTKDVPDYALVIGNPAKIAGWMCRCGNKLGFVKAHATCKKCDREYEKQGELVSCRNEEGQQKKAANM